MNKIKELRKEVELEQKYLEGVLDTLNKIENIDFTPQKTFNDYTWQEIQTMVKSGNHPFKVGDIKKIDFRAEEHEIIIIGINHNGENTITCQFRDIVFHKEMNDETTNEGGFAASDLYKYLNKDFKEELKKVIPIIENLNLFIPSEFEVFGKNKYSEKEDGEKQYDYYKEIRNRVKFNKEDDYSRSWWLRSADRYGTSPFVSISSDGSVSSYGANYTYGVAPCFII